MLRAGHDALWEAQREWIEATLGQAADELPGAPLVHVVSESLHDAEASRWASLGFLLVFEELAMELDLSLEGTVPPSPWPRTTRVLDWGPVIEAARRMRAGGSSIARLHVNTNNDAALGAWRALGWRVAGRRGRFERNPVPR